MLSIVQYCLLWALWSTILSTLGQCAPLSPLDKRISQTLTSATIKWNSACVSAGGGSTCQTLVAKAAASLTSTADVCAQQDVADQMIGLAHNLGTQANMITLTQIFVQQPRDTTGSLSTPYCQRAPASSELQGLYQCQFHTVSHTWFAGGLKIGSKGTIPFGLVNAVNPAGGCPAHQNGPIPDGIQLSDITTNPGLGNVVESASS
ncbi:hypothetical protein DL93DRAFT_2135498 [Clavulina sp. PMI_390]|nr:hypothetical protein DL93DRAFT_2135498 [Clavulina sp. PMI_390]